MNITDLQEKAKDLLLEIEKLKKDTEQIEKSDGLGELEKIKATAKKTKITNDILKNASEFEQKLYLTVLCSIADKEENFDARNNQLMLINRIIEGSSAENTLEDLMSKAKIIDNKFLADFTENITNKISESFAVDALILYGLNPKNEKMLEYITEIFTLLNCDEENLNIYCEIAQAVVTQNIERLHNIYNMLILDFSKYIEQKNITYYTTDNLFSCKDVTAEIFVIGQTITADDVGGHESNFRVLDNISSNKITFLNCTFTDIHSLYFYKNRTEVLSFINCKFTSCGNYNGNAVYLDVKYTTFSNCEFVNCESNSQVFYAILCFQSCDNGTVENCIFKKCLCTKAISSDFYGRTNIIQKNNQVIH